MEREAEKNCWIEVSARPHDSPYHTISVCLISSTGTGSLKVAQSGMGARRLLIEYTTSRQVSKEVTTSKQEHILALCSALSLLSSYHSSLQPRHYLSNPCQAPDFKNPGSSASISRSVTDIFSTSSFKLGSVVEYL